MSLDKAKKMLDDERGPLARMGNARTVFKAALDLGAVVAEVGLCFSSDMAYTK